MSELSWALLIIFFTVVATLLAVVAGALVYALVEVRATMRSVRETVERLAPKVDLALDNICQVSDAAARGSTARTQLVQSLPGRSAKTVIASSPLWGLVVAGLAGFFSAFRRRRAARRAAAKR